MQEMQYFIPNETFNNAIKRKEKGVLKALLIGIIGSDPTFETEEYHEAESYIESQSKNLNGEVLNLLEPYQRQEDEYTRTEAEGWDEDYYQMLLVWYRDNFAKERFQTIQVVGKVVYRDKPTLGKSKRHNRVIASHSLPRHTSVNEIQRKKVSVVRSTDNDEVKERLKQGSGSKWKRVLVSAAIIFTVIAGLVAVLYSVSK